MSNLIKLRRKDTGTSWGFRLAGGTEYGQPLHIMKVMTGSISHKTGMRSGDLVLQIGSTPTSGMTLDGAKSEILRSGNELDLILNRTVIPLTASPPVTVRKQVVESPSPFKGSPTSSPQVQSRSFKMLQAQVVDNEGDVSEF